MKVLAVTGGMGVFAYALKKYLIGNVEPRSLFYSKGNPQWKANFKKAFLCRTLEEIPREFEGIELDAIIGAPDCGHSSILALSRQKKMGEPKNNKSLSLFIESVNLFQPKLFFMENLPALLDTYGKQNLKEAFPRYDLKFIQGPVSIFGNSQRTRKRLLVVGCNRKYDMLPVIKKPKENLSKLSNCKNLLKGLEIEKISTGHIREPLSTNLTLYAGYKETAKEIQRIWNMRPGQKRWKVEGRNFTTAPGVYRNLDNDYPVTARKANRQYNSQGLMMSPRELARIQGLPDNFKIHIDSQNQKYWINKGRTAVTKCPPYEMGLWVKKKLLKLKKQNLL